jgi:hypothetical protein
MYLYPHSP